MRRAILLRAVLMTVAVLVSALALTHVAWAQTTDRGTYRINYFDNANTQGAPDAQVRITNPGTATLFDDVDLPRDLCAMIFVFRPDQQLAECCGCKVTPNGLLTLSVNDDLTSNPLTAVPFTTGVIKIVSTLETLTEGPPGSSKTCNPGDATWLPAKELRSWGTHIQNASPLTTFLITETAFEGNDNTRMLSFVEQLRLKTLCGAIVGGVIPGGTGLGSGFGLCRCPGESNPHPAGVDPPLIGTIPLPGGLLR